MIYMPLIVMVLIIVINLWFYLRLICCFARRTSIRDIADLHHPPADAHHAAPFRSAIAYERHR